MTTTKGHGETLGGNRMLLYVENGGGNKLL